MEEKISTYIDKKFKLIYFIIALLVTIILGLSTSSFFSFKTLGNVEAEITMVRKADFVERQYFEEYMKRVILLVEANQKLCTAVRTEDLKTISRIESDIRDIKIDIRALGNEIGMYTRSGNSNN